MDVRPTDFRPDDDPYLWLEEVDGPRAIAWVGEQNKATLARLGALFCTIPLIDMQRFTKLLAGAAAARTMPGSRPSPRSATASWAGRPAGTRHRRPGRAAGPALRVGFQAHDMRLGRQRVVHQQAPA